MCKGVLSTQHVYEYCSLGDTLNICQILNSNVKKDSYCLIY